MIVSRRSILAFGAGAAVHARTQARAGCQTNAWKIDAPQFPRLLNVLDAIRKSGFAGFETGFRNLESQFADPKPARALLRKSGLRFLGCHIFMNEYDPKTGVAPWDVIERVARGAAALGAERLILSGAPLATPAAKADALNRAGRFCHDLKMMRVAYHNHGPEFRNGGEEIEALVKHTDPSSVRFIVDCGHALRAQADVAAFFAKHSPRIDGLHLRDFRDGVQVPFGQGAFDYKPLAARVKAAAYSGWLIAEEERDNGDKPGESAAAPAREAIRKLFEV